MYNAFKISKEICSRSKIFLSMLKKFKLSYFYISKKFLSLLFYINTNIFYTNKLIAASDSIPIYISM